jgi:hypothetical protein
MNFHTVNRAVFEETVRPFATQLAKKGTFQGWYLTRRYPTMMAVTLGATGLV